MIAPEDTLHWSHWWYLESARFLDLRSVVQGPPVSGGRRISSASPLAPSRATVDADVIPALLGVARSTSDGVHRDAALIALGRLTSRSSAHGDEVLAALTSALASKRARGVESATLGLGLLASPEGNTALRALATDAPAGHALVASTRVPRRVQAFAAHALGLSADRSQDTEEHLRTAHTLLGILDARHAEANLPVAAASALGIVPLPATALVPPADLRGEKGIERVLSSRSVARELAPWATGEAVGKTPHVARWEVRAHAAVAYARAAARAGGATRAAAIRDLTRSLSAAHDTQFERTGAVVALGEIVDASLSDADVAARRALQKIAREGQPLERRFAQISLGWAGARPGDGDDPFSASDDVEQFLTSAVERQRAGELAWSALALGVLQHGRARANLEPSERAVRTLRSLASKRRGDDDSAALGLALALTLGGSDDQGNAFQGLSREFGETASPDMRGNLALALGMFGDRGARAELRVELDRARAQPVHLWTTALALALLGDNRSDALVARLDASNSVPMQIGLAAALGQIGTARTVAPLLELVGDDTRADIARAAAVDALASVCDLEVLPWRDPYAHALPYFAITSVLRSGGDGLLERAW